MSILIFGDLFTFPEGTAATNRVFTYAKGFVENGINVHVICFTNDSAEIVEGRIDGIYFYQPFGKKKRSTYFIIRIFQKMMKFFNAYGIVKKISKSDKVIAINGWSNFISTKFFGYLLSRLTSSKFVVELSEHPLRLYQGNLLKEKQGTANFYVETAISDGFFCISHYLINFCKQKGIASRKLFLVPSTVDPKRFIVSAGSPVGYRYIGYFGSLTFDRDNIDLLIKAFAAFSKEVTDLHLILGGFCTDVEKLRIEDLITELNLGSKVHLLGFLKREEIVKYISNAHILILTRTNNLESRASYPSKLTEFLTSSKPVIAVNVGEISLYLTDGLNVFLVEPDNAAALTEKLHYVCDNYELAMEVGKRGRELTESIFNYKYQADRMISFIDTL